MACIAKLFCSCVQTIKLGERRARVVKLREKNTCSFFIFFIFLLFLLAALLMSSYFFFNVSAMRFISICSIYSRKENSYMHNKQHSSMKQNMIYEQRSRMTTSLNYPWSNFRILCLKVKISCYSNFYNLLAMAR